MPLRLTQALANVLYVLQHDPPPHYPYHLAKRTAVTQGAIYNLLDRLEEHGLVTSDLEDIDPKVAGRPARRHFALTVAGRERATTLTQARPPLLPRVP